MTKNSPGKRKHKTTKRFRQIRLLVLLIFAAGLAFYRTPLLEAVRVGIPPKTSSASTPAALLSIPALEGSAAVRNGTVYLLQRKALKALKADGSLIWEKALTEPALSVIPSYDGIFVKSQKGPLLRYSSLGKFMNEITVPGSFGNVYESAKGILFEDRALRQYFWTDVAGKLLGTQQLAEEQILKTAVDPESGDAVIATLKADGATLESALHRFDANGRLIGARTFRDAVVLDMEFMESRLVVILDDRLISLDAQMEDHWLVKEPVKYQGASFGKKSFWINRVQDDQMLQCYSVEGKVLISLPFKEPMTLMEAGEGNQVAVVSGQRVQVYSEKGDQLSDLTLAKVPQRLFWLSDKHLLIFYGDSASIENIGTRSKM